VVDPRVHLVWFFPGYLRVSQVLHPVAGQFQVLTGTSMGGIQPFHEDRDVVSRGLLLASRAPNSRSRTPSWRASCLCHLRLMICRPAGRRVFTGPSSLRCVETSFLTCFATVLFQCAVRLCMQRNVPCVAGAVTAPATVVTRTEVLLCCGHVWPLV
jgi:hypothetical protein